MTVTTTMNVPSLDQPSGIEEIPVKHDELHNDDGEQRDLCYEEDTRRDSPRRFARRMFEVRLLSCRPGAELLLCRLLSRFLVRVAVMVRTVLSNGFSAIATHEAQGQLSTGRYGRCGGGMCMDELEGSKFSSKECWTRFMIPEYGTSDGR